jgi:hypothetical protein
MIGKSVRPEVSKDERGEHATFYETVNMITATKHHRSDDTEVLRGKPCTEVLMGNLFELEEERYWTKVQYLSSFYSRKFPITRRDRSLSIERAVPKKTEEVS